MSERVRFDPLSVVVSVDTDEDAFDTMAFGEPTGGAFTTLEPGIHSLLEALGGMRDASDRSVAYTWFVRCDGEVARLSGDELFVLRTLDPLWVEREAVGDEIGWHPHLFGSISEVEDADGALDEEVLRLRLSESYTAFVSHGRVPRCSRIGRAFLTAGLLRFLEGTGVAVDSTALPGRVRKDPLHHIDWAGTPERPYRPCLGDPRREGEPASRLIEVPMTMIEVRAPYDTDPVRRYTNLAYRHEIVRDAFADAALATDLLVTVVHPYEIVPGPKHGLVSFDPADVAANMRTILESCSAVGRPVRFVTLTEGVRIMGEMRP